MTVSVEDAGDAQRESKRERGREGEMNVSVSVASLCMYQNSQTPFDGAPSHRRIRSPLAPALDARLYHTWVNDMNINEIRYASFDETMSRRVLRPRRKTSRYGIGFRNPFAMGICNISMMLGMRRRMGSPEIAIGVGGDVFRWTSR